MALTGTRTFVGFGFGAIQSGLFLYEAFFSGAFRRLVVAEVLQDVVSAVRLADNTYGVNIAYHDRVGSARIGPVEIQDPAAESDRQQVIDAIVEAEELATAVPSVAFYSSDKPGSIHRLLATGLCKKIEQGGPRAVIYAAENHNHAAEILEQRVMEQIPENQHAAVRARVRFLNTVIGKMSHVVTDAKEIQTQQLATIAPDFQRAFLVESFNRILISKIDFPEPFQRGIEVLQEKNDLLPFEEAKLYGHNATHALIGYIGALIGAQRVADLQEAPGVVSLARAAFIEESGEALIRKYRGVDPLFTPEGYREYADDLIERMMNPFLVDSIERVTRDTERKLGWNDRLIGTMRLALQQGVRPRRYALGAAAALAVLDSNILDSASPSAALTKLWGDVPSSAKESEAVLGMIEDASQRLKAWHTAGFPDLEAFYR
jgi:mannitol-1-phosphate/altronate dehydrogenase